MDIVSQNVNVVNNVKFLLKVVNVKVEVNVYQIVLVKKKKEFVILWYVQVVIIGKNQILVKIIWVSILELKSLELDLQVSKKQD